MKIDHVLLCMSCSFSTERKLNTDDLIFCFFLKVMAFELDEDNLMSVSFTLPLPKNLQVWHNI